MTYLRVGWVLTCFLTYPLTRSWTAMALVIIAAGISYTAGLLEARP
jgi:hypothetical protein